MKAELATRLEKFKSICTMQQIEQWRTDFLSLRIQGIDDKDGYKKVYDAIQIIKQPRINLKKATEEETREAIDYHKAVLAASKSIQSLLDPIENYLKGERKRIDDLIEAEKQRKIYFDEISACWDQAHTDNEQVNQQIAEKAHQEELRIENERKEKELAERQAAIEQKEREEKIRKEEREQAEREKQEEKRRAEQAIKDAEHKAELEKLRADERIREEKKRLEREAKEAEKKRIADEKARKEAEQKRLDEEKRQAELAPDRDKIEKYLADICDIPLPELKDNNLSVILKSFDRKLKADCKAFLLNIKK